MAGDRRTFPALAESVPQVRETAVAWALGEGAGGDTLHSIALAVTEAATNVVVHAYRGADSPGDITLEFARDGGDLRISVCDEGVGMAPRADSPGLGLGMPLIANLADRLEVDATDGGGTQISMHFPAGSLCTA